MKIKNSNLYMLAINGEQFLAFQFIDHYQFLPIISIIGEITIWLICNIGLIVVQDQINQ